MKKVNVLFLLIVFLLVYPFGEEVLASKYPDVNNYIKSNNLKAPQIEYNHNDRFTIFNYRYGLGMVEGLVAHETANSTSTIIDEINYMNRNHRNAFVHAFIDHNRIIEIHPTEYGAWGAGRVANQRYVHVELVRVHSFSKFARAMNNYSDYIARVLYSNGLKITDAERTGKGTLWSHNAVSNFLGGTNHVDPHGYFNQWGYNWNDFVELVTYKYQKLKSSCSGVCWDGFKMERGQVGSLDILKPINVWKRDKDNQLQYVGVLPPDKKVNVFQYDSLHGGQYNIGDNLWVTNINGYIKYNTPSKSKLNQLAEYIIDQDIHNDSTPTGTGVFWNNREMEVGEIGRLTITKPINIWGRDTNNQLMFLKIARPGEVISVFGFDNKYGGQYRVGENLWITNMGGYVSYSTPSKSKLDKLAKYMAEQEMHDDPIPTGTNVFWNGREMEVGERGRLAVEKPINVWERDANNQLKFFKIAQPGEILSVFDSDSNHGGQYKVGENLWITNMTGYVSYSTPSKSKLDQLLNYERSIGINTIAVASSQGINENDDVEQEVKEGTVESIESDLEIDESESESDSDGAGVYWNELEMEIGERGRLTVSKPINVWGRDADNQLKFVKIAQPGDLLSVFGSDSNHGGQYRVGENLWVTNMTGYISYSTPSKSKLDQLLNYEQSIGLNTIEEVSSQDIDENDDVEQEVKEGTVESIESDLEIDESESDSDSDGTGVYWNELEMEIGERGRLTVFKSINIWERDADNQLKFVKIAQPGDLLIVFDLDDNHGGQYRVGENLWVTDIDDSVSYNTPTISLLEKLRNYEETLN